MGGVARTRHDAVIDPDGPALPSLQQVAALRTFIDGRTYAALGATIRLSDDPPLTPGSGLARAKEINGAFFGVIARLAELLQAELRAGDRGEVTAVLWGLMLRSARPWADEPALSAELRVAVSGPRAERAEPAPE